MLKLFADESGKGTPPVFVMAGLIARAEQWTAFNEAWRAELAKPPAKEYFHLSEALWVTDFERIGRLAAIVKDHALVSITVTVMHEDYNAVLRGRVGRGIDHPYFLMYHALMAQCFAWSVGAGINEKIDFIFDEQREETDTLQSIWSGIVDLAPDEIKSRVGNRPIHVDDKEHPPLQGADLLAGVLRRAIDELHQGKVPAPFLTELFRGLPTVHDHWSKERLEKFLSDIQQVNRGQGKIFEHESATSALAGWSAMWIGTSTNTKPT